MPAQWRRPSIREAVKFLNNLSVQAGLLRRSSFRENDILVGLQSDSDKIVAAAGQYYEWSGNVLAFQEGLRLDRYPIKYCD